MFSGGNGRHKNLGSRSENLFPKFFRVFAVSRKPLCYYSNVGSAGLVAVCGICLGIEGNLLTLLKRLEALSIDSGEMYEYFLAGCIVGDETITLLCVEPLNCTVIHDGTSLKI